jgi:hypothetical protein
MRVKAGLWPQVCPLIHNPNTMVTPSLVNGNDCVCIAKMSFPIPSPAFASGGCLSK